MKYYFKQIDSQCLNVRRVGDTRLDEHVAYIECRDADGLHEILKALVIGGIGPDLLTDEIQFQFLPYYENQIDFITACKENGYDVDWKNNDIYKRGLRGKEFSEYFTSFFVDKFGGIFIKKQ
jgi:hypothetical protein